MSNGKNGLKSVIFDLSRIAEWWLISLGLILFAFVPYTYLQNDSRISLSILSGLLTTPPLYIAIITVFTSQIFLFAGNDYYDRHVDALDPKKKTRNPVCNGSVSEGGVRALLVVSGVLPLVASAYFGLTAFAYTAFTLFVFFFYTAPPLRFKNKVVLDVLSHGLFINTFPYMFCLVALGDFSFGSVFLLTALMMRSAMAQLLQEIRDHGVDSKVERNTAIVLGQRRAMWLVFGIYITLFALTATLHITYMLWGWGISLFYVIILILCISFIPVFRKLMSAQDYGREIESLWMGQGRTNRWQVAQYFIAFSAYAVIVFHLMTSGY